MKEKVTLLEYSFGTVFHEDGVEEDACYICAARAYGKSALVREARRWFEKGERSCWGVLREMGEKR